MLFRWLTAEDRDRQPDRQFDVIDRWLSRHNIRLLALDEVLDLFLSFGAVEKHLRQREVVRKA